MSTLNVVNIKNEAANSDSIQISTDGSMTLLGDVTVGAGNLKKPDGN